MHEEEYVCPSWGICYQVRTYGQWTHHEIHPLVNLQFCFKLQEKFSHNTVNLKIQTLVHFYISS
jgi:hypothetical protein